MAIFFFFLSRDCDTVSVLIFFSFFSLCVCDRDDSHRDSCLVTTRGAGGLHSPSGQLPVQPVSVVLCLSVSLSVSLPLLITFFLFSEKDTTCTSKKPLVGRCISVVTRVSPFQ
jgi:hypothetical protein